MKKEELRKILRRKFSADADRFQIIKEVAMLVVTEQSCWAGVCSSIIVKD